MREYLVRVDQEFALDADRLLLGRRDLGIGGIDYLLEDGTWRHLEETAMRPDNAGVLLPRGAWEAIREYAYPGPARGEIQRLEEALAIERARVDHVIGRSS